ncbi:MAG: YraN family protein [Woeseiaceae bacterium]|jgi:putative endonuclease
MGRRATGPVGARAESAAFDYLIRQGLRPVARNFRCRGGEIDLIMIHDQCLVFIEVRYRATADFAQPSHTVDRHKQRKIIRTAAMFSARNRAYAAHVMRFDVVAMEGYDPPSIRWLRDAFRPHDSTL